MSRCVLQNLEKFLFRFTHLIVASLLWCKATLIICMIRIQLTGTTANGPSAFLAIQVIFFANLLKHTKEIIARWLMSCSILVVMREKFVFFTPSIKRETRFVYHPRHVNINRKRNYFSPHMHRRSGFIYWENEIFVNLSESRHTQYGAINERSWKRRKFVEISPFTLSFVGW